MLITERESPIVIPPTFTPSDPAHSAAFIFLHGFGDDAAGLEGVARQYQSAEKLPYMKWIIPNALENRNAMQKAWYTPASLSPFPSSRPELDDPEDEDGMKFTVDYIVTLVDDLVSQGIPGNRIVLGGFSQGCAMTLLTGLTSKYAGKLAGLVCLSGYLPLVDKISELRRKAGLPESVEDNVDVFIARGTRDMLIPKRYLQICQEKLKEMGVKESNIEAREYEGMGHAMGTAELRDLCTWFEKTVPPLIEMKEK
ncbi:alpha/beta-hydrolase [Glonium stellatum]|uniref:Acyl-protein thioesterase 1 n=1 Tax=Glonium stellatum TaxID=574774 RepID=A0A8E2JYF4_9PEZI|nr:alpha/beta-hydrolase [Glonium stellatum]